MRVGELELDVPAYQLSRAGKPVEIQNVPLDLLILLVENAGRVVSRQEIIDRLWGKDVFLEYITDPKAKIPGTKMVFAGIKNEKERNDLWAYVSQFDKDGKKK